MKTELLSWRLSRKLKSQIEREARRRKVPLSTVVETAVREHLTRRDEDDEAEQRRIRAIALSFSGIIKGGDPHRSQRVREIIQEDLAKRYGR